MKTRKTLSAHLDKQLNNYIAAARAESRSHQFLTAAAIGLASLSIAPALNAEIVYTPTDKRVGGLSNGFSTLQIDLNNDGVADIVLDAYNIRSFSSGIRILDSLDARGLNGNQVQEASQGLAAADAAGQIIGSLSARARFRTSGLMASYSLAVSEFFYHKTSKGFWRNATNLYLGVKFYFNGEIHYGWARLNAGAGWAQLTGYAYETEPNKPIRAGVLPTPESNAAPQKPATLGVLAMGAVRMK